MASHGNDVVALAQNLCVLLCHGSGSVDAEKSADGVFKGSVIAFCHQQACAILDDECPAHDLCTDIAELCQHALTVMVSVPQAPHGRAEIDVVALVTVLRHLDTGEDNEHADDNKSYGEVWPDEDGEVAVTQCCELLIGECGTLCRGQRAETVLYECHCHKHSA